MTSRSYVAIFGMGIKLGLQYRFHLFINLLALPLSLIVYYFLWISVYAATGEDQISGYSIGGIVSYYVLSMLLGLVVWSDVDAWMEGDVRKGEAIVDLLQPVTIMAKHFWTECGMRLLSISISAAPIVLLAILAFDAQFALHSLVPLALLSVGLAMLLIFLMAYLIGLFTFWLKRNQGLRRVNRAIILFFSGGMIPLSFFPDWWAPISKFLPYEYVRAVPIAIYQQQTSSLGWSSPYLAVGGQLLWILVLYGFCKWLESHALRQLEGAGA